MTSSQDVVFPLDVDNTLLDNDECVANLRGHLELDISIKRIGDLLDIDIAALRPAESLSAATQDTP